MLNETGSNSEAKTNVQEALSLIASARASIGMQDLASAREDQGAALDAIEYAKELIEQNDNADNTSAVRRG